METNSEIRKIEIGPDILKYLNTTRKWTMFFAILGFIFIGMMIFAGVAAGVFLSFFDSGTSGADIPEWILLPVLLGVALLYFFPVLFLFQFSTHMRNAVQTFSEVDLKKAFRNMKSYWVYLGVLVIVILSFYVIVLVAAGSSLAFLKTIN